jgi:hypothetical protein
MGRIRIKRNKTNALKSTEKKKKMSNHANMTTHKEEKKAERRRPCTSGRFLRAERGDGLGPASPHGDRCSRRVSDPQAPDRRLQPAPAPAGAEARHPRLQRQAHAPRLHCSLDRWCSAAARGEGGRGDQSATSAAFGALMKRRGGRRRQLVAATQWWKCGDLK